MHDGDTDRHDGEGAAGGREARTSPLLASCPRVHRVEVDQRVRQSVGGVLEDPAKLVAHGRSPSASASMR